MTSGSPLKHLLEKVKGMISGQPRKRKEEPPVKPQEKTGKGSLRCPHHFGYLANRPKNAPISGNRELIAEKLFDPSLKVPKKSK